MAKTYVKELIKTVEDIGYTLASTGSNDIEDGLPAPAPQKTSNRFSTVTKGDFGHEFDYETYDQVDQIVIYPVCQAALYWLEDNLPDGITRWHGVGFKLPANEAQQVMKGMYRAGLHSLEEREAEEQDKRRQDHD